MPPRKAAKATIVREAAEIASYLRDLSHRYVAAPAEADKARSGLTNPQITAITILYDRGPLSLKDLSNAAGLSHSTVSGIVDRLERRGLVLRSVEPSDRRVSRIEVTDEVNLYVREQLEREQVGRLLPILEAFTRDERRAIREGLRLLHARVRDE